MTCLALAVHVGVMGDGPVQISHPRQRAAFDAPEHQPNMPLDTKRIVLTGLVCVT